MGGFQYHNKVTCFMLHQIEEPCSLGAHAGVIVPPSWIIKVRKPQVNTHPDTRSHTHTRSIAVTLSVMKDD